MSSHKTFKTHFIAYVAASVDGRISLSSAAMPQWTSKEDWQFLQRSLARCDAVVVGRNTYQAAQERLRRRNTFVLTHRPKTTVRRGPITFVNPDKVNLARLLETYTTVAVLGGGLVYRYMLDKGLLDELYVTIEPLVFGRGKEMFIGGRRTARLRLLSVRRFNQGGSLLLHYKVIHS